MEHVFCLSATIEPRQPHTVNNRYPKKSAAVCGYFTEPQLFRFFWLGCGVMKDLMLAGDTTGFWKVALALATALFCLNSERMWQERDKIKKDDEFKREGKWGNRRDGLCVCPHGGGSLGRSLGWLHSSDRVRVRGAETEKPQTFAHSTSLSDIIFHSL